MASCSLLLTTGDHLLKTDGYRLTLTSDCGTPTRLATFAEHTTARHHEHTTGTFAEHTTARTRER
jgi:hypothetical protein